MVFFSTIGHDLAFNALSSVLSTLGCSPIGSRNPQSDKLKLSIRVRFEICETVCEERNRIEHDLNEFYLPKRVFFLLLDCGW